MTLVFKSLDGAEHDLSTETGESVWEWLPATAQFRCKAPIYFKNERKTCAAFNQIVLILCGRVIAKTTWPNASRCCVGTKLGWKAGELLLSTL